VTTTLDRPLLTGPANGGVAARRAVIHWAWRQLRRGWRQQFVVTVLLALAVLGAVVGGSAATNLTPRADARFGRADELVQLDASNPQTLQAGIALARQRLGRIELIDRQYVPVPGSVETLELRGADPNGAYGSPLIVLRQGRLPKGAGETALTDGAAQLLDLRIGGTLTAGGQHRTVVGRVENPRDFKDDFALVAPGTLTPQAVTVLANTSPDTFDAYRQASKTPLVTQTLQSSGRAASGGVLAVVTVLLLLISLVAAAAFAVIAQRRLRQIGMLAAIGATQKQLRLVLLANGAAVGIFAAVAGTVGGLLTWIPVCGLLESAAGHRIAPTSVPGGLVVECALLAIAMATAAAWWPARTVARVPIVIALSDWPPQPKPSHRPAVLALVFLVVGVGSLALANQENPLLIIIGTLGTVLGILFVSPLAIKVIGLAGSRAPIAPRLALRDLARYRARSAAALAAISLALGIPAAIIITATAAQDTEATGNLSNGEILVRIGQPDDPVIPLRTDAELAALTTQVNRIAAQLSRPKVIPLDMAVDPTIKPEPGFQDSQGGQPVAELGIPRGATAADDASGTDRFSGSLGSVPLYVATPEVLAFLRVDPAIISPTTDLLTTQHGQAEIPNITHPETLTNIVRIKGSGYTSEPNSVLTTGGLERRHWGRIRMGWLVESGKPLTSAQLVSTRHIAAGAGVTVETRNQQRSLGQIRAIAAAAGMLLALGVLAMTIGLIRIETAGDLRTLTATGASSRIRRTLTAATAGGLALTGAVLGTLGAYAGLLAGYSRDMGKLSHVPVLYLLVIAIGVPLAAAAAGWVLAGREPPVISRHAIE
jgi:putative ABC transport system permease protein